MKKRQKIRKAIILISFLLFPITIYYLSPYLPFRGSAEGVMAGSLIVFSCMFVLALFLGRAFCGWVCPAGGVQECCMIAVDKRARGGKYNWIKIMIWFLWLGSLTAIIISKGGFKKVDFLYQTFYGISVSSPGAYVIYYGVLALIVVLSLTAGRRAFCHYVCWMAPFMIIGGKIGKLLRIPSLRLSAEKNKCINCKLCTKKCPMSLNVDEMVQNRSMHNSECILCGECADVCPKGVISYCFKKRSSIS